MVFMGLSKEIEELREELNKATEDKWRRDKEEIIIISRKLDVLIYRYYLSRKKERLAEDMCL
jgi:hypothetical protein